MKTTSSELRIDVAPLRRRPGIQRAVVVSAAVPDLSAGMVRVGDEQPVRADLVLESITEGIVVRGTVAVDWTAECARCLEPMRGATRVHVDELFEAEPVEGETYPLDGDVLDLEQALRDALVLEFPLAPVPETDVEGRCRQCGRAPDELFAPPETDQTDPRWEALRSLDL